MKIPKWSAEAVNRSIDNTMPKRKEIKVVSRSRKSQYRQYNAQKKRDKECSTKHVCRVIPVVFEHYALYYIFTKKGRLVQMHIEI